MFRSAVSYLKLFFTLIIHIPAMRRMNRMIKDSGDASGAEIHRFVSKWVRGILKPSGARAHITGLDNIPGEAPVLFISNHQSDVDILLFLAYSPLPIGFVAKVEMRKVPLVRTWMENIRCVFLDRKDIRQSAKAILEGIDVLKSGYSLVLFPEGTRAKSSVPLPFKAGSFKLATRSGATVVPVTIDGSYKIMEENHYKVTPADVYITFHEAILTAELDKEELAALPRRVEETIKAALPSA